MIGDTFPNIENHWIVVLLGASLSIFLFPFWRHHFLVLFVTLSCVYPQMSSSPTPRALSLNLSYTYHTRVLKPPNMVGAFVLQAACWLKMEHSCIYQTFHSTFLFALHTCYPNMLFMKLWKLSISLVCLYYHSPRLEKLHTCLSLLVT